MNKNIYNAMGKKAKDECYTSYCEAAKLARFLIENHAFLTPFEKKIWLPFDNELSNIYKALHDAGFKNLILTNLEAGLDFYIHEPKEWDLIITNPPFSDRTQLFRRLLSFKKPFVILQATQMFNNQHAVKAICDNGESFKFILPRSRMNFITFNEKENRLQSSKSAASFYSFWLCYKTGLLKTFNSLADSGDEKKVEVYDREGNVIKDNHRSLFTMFAICGGGL